MEVDVTDAATDAPNDRSWTFFDAERDVDACLGDFASSFSGDADEDTENEEEFDVVVDDMIVVLVFFEAV